MRNIFTHSNVRWPQIYDESPFAELTLSFRGSATDATRSTARSRRGPKTHISPTIGR